MNETGLPEINRVKPKYIPLNTKLLHTFSPRSNKSISLVYKRANHSSCLAGILSRV